ncbi:DMT family transporter [Enterovirga rhinocerotis]|uniref:DMT family transporter n=1 Tax=Enterovirga rhinocerotis TaxID=1339210 RepID=UPI001FE07FBD|nr:DMT family transporter [Enterovirga rhinocerotis]
MPARDGQASDRGGGRLSAIALMCAAVFCFACLDACGKWATRHVDPVVTTWFRYAVSVVFLSVFLNGWTRPRIMHTNRLTLQVVRSLLLFGSTILNFFALQYLQLTQAISIQFAMPLLVALLAGPLLGEWVGPRRLVAIVIGFLGVLVITRPGSGSLHPAAFLTVVNTVFYALYALITRMLAAHDPPVTTMTYSGLAGVVLLTPILPFFWAQPPGPAVWAALLATGVLGAVGHGLLTVAHSRAPASVLSPFIYTQIVWMTALGYFVFGDLPDRYTAIGAAIVIGSGLYLLSRERTVRAKQPA